MYVYVCICMCVYMCVYVCVCMCMYVYIHVYISFRISFRISPVEVPAHSELRPVIPHQHATFQRSCAFVRARWSLLRKKMRFCFALGARLGRPRPISRRLGRSWDRFGRPKRLYFGSSWLRSRVRCVLRPMATKHCKKWYRTHIGAVARHAKNDQNSCSERSCPGSTLRTRSVATSACHRSVPGSV